MRAQRSSAERHDRQPVAAVVPPQGGSGACCPFDPGRGSDLAGRAIGWLQGRRFPRWARWLTRAVPVLRLGPFPVVVVFGSDEARSVLRRADTFVSGPSYRELMPLRALVDDDDGPRHDLERGWLEPLVGPDALARAAAVADGAVVEVLDAALRRAGAAEVDVAAVARHVVADAVVGACLGVGGDRAWREEVSAVLFRTSFNRRSASPEERQAGPVALAAARAAAQDALEDLPPRPPAVGDAQASDLLVSLLVASVEIVRASVLVVDHLLDDPSLDAVAVAARGGDRGAVAASVDAAMRARPNHPFLPRTAASGTRLGTRGSRVRPGDRVVVLLSPAIAEEGDGSCAAAGGPPSIPFGLGRHACPGWAIAREVVTSIVAALLARGIRRASGPAGRVRRIGLEPDRLHVLVGADRGAVPLVPR